MNTHLCSRFEKQGCCPHGHNKAPFRSRGNSEFFWIFRFFFFRVLWIQIKMQELHNMLFASVKSGCLWYPPDSLSRMDLQARVAPRASQVASYLSGLFMHSLSRKTACPQTEDYYNMPFLSNTGRRRSRWHEGSLQHAFSKRFSVKQSVCGRHVRPGSCCSWRRGEDAGNELWLGPTCCCGRKFFDAIKPRSTHLWWYHEGVRQGVYTGATSRVTTGSRVRDSTMIIR